MEDINIQIEPCKTYFSDGCVDSAGPDEIDLLREQPKTNSDDSASWSSWIMKQTTSFGSNALSTVDYLGESLANFFGITTPKYQFEINYHKNIMQEMNAEKVSNEENMKGWTQTPQKCIINTEPC
ncbi:protein FAM177A1-like isoform X2 [Sipha flava]|nr:protein FAM177A1-like isoform X2 [Sipha flava]XP_025424719.1 protein FAM177A1-like isoform X2 [Sipha flava]XP_025424720.1 protein FAM177A1-like isoform X2 [Sipha flava]